MNSKTAVPCPPSENAFPYPPLWTSDGDKVLSKNPQPVRTLGSTNRYTLTQPLWHLTLQVVALCNHHTRAQAQCPPPPPTDTQQTENIPEENITFGAGKKFFGCLRPTLWDVQCGQQVSTEHSVAAIQRLKCDPQQCTTAQPNRRR